MRASLQYLHGKSYFSIGGKSGRSDIVKGALIGAAGGFIEEDKDGLPDGGVVFGEPLGDGSDGDGGGFLEG